MKSGQGLVAPVSSSALAGSSSSLAFVSTGSLLSFLHLSMAATIMMNQHYGFQTTHGFQVSSGFEVAASNAAQEPVTPGKQLTSETSAGSATKQDTPKRLGVGWKGLLESSRGSGAPGVMGKAGLPVDAEAAMDSKLEICCTAHTDPATRRLVKEVIRGLKACQEPEKALDGMGGTYFFLNDQGRKAAILKPCDEEPLAPNNPKGYVGRQLGDAGWKPTVRVGEAAMREVAAYLLDHEHFARVPTSVLVRARHPVFCYQDRFTGRSPLDQPSAGGAVTAMRSNSMFADAIIADDGFLDADGGMETTAVAGAGVRPSLPMKLGSLQKFVAHECDTSEMGASRFSVSDVHRIGILDLRLFNTDRHAGNMLVRTTQLHSQSSAALNALDAWSAGTNKYELIPIDHGFCLPETLEAPFFEWLHWPQAMMPFSQEELAYIRNLNIEADKELLRKELPALRPECLRVLEVATTVLQAGAAAGLTLYELASIMTRGMLAGGDEEPSELEIMVTHARETAEASHYDLQDSTNSDLSDESDDEFDLLSMVDMDISTEVSPVGGAYRNMHVGPTIRSNGELLIFSYYDSDQKLHAQTSSVISAGSSLSSADVLSLTPPSCDTPRGRRTSSSGGNMGGGSSSGFPSLMAATSSANKMMGSVRTPEYSVSAFAPMARSVAADGSIWRRHQKQRRRAAAGAVATARRPAPQAYPPPVVPGIKATEASSSVFSDLSDAQWGTFMSALSGLVMAGLAKGSWRAAGNKAASVNTAGVAMSCPRFG